MRKRVAQGTIIADVLLFILSTGLLSVLAQKSAWLLFTIVLFISAGVFLLVRYAQSQPAFDRLNGLEQRQFSLALKTKKLGINEIFDMNDHTQQDARNKLTVDIIKDSHVLSLMSLTAASYIDPSVKRHWDHLKRKLDMGVPFRLLILNPYCDEKKVRDQANGISTTADLKARLDLVAELYNRYSNVAVRVSSHNIYCALFFSDSDMVYDLYHLGKVGDRIENHFLALHLVPTSEIRDPTDRSYFDILRLHFEYLWSLADEFEMFLQQHKAVIDQTPFRDVHVQPRLGPR